MCLYHLFAVAITSALKLGNSDDTKLLHYIRYIGKATAKENSLQNDKVIIYFPFNVREPRAQQRIGKSHLEVVAFYPLLLMCSTFVLDNQQIKIKLIGFNYI